MRSIFYGCITGLYISKKEAKKALKTLNTLFPGSEIVEVIVTEQEAEVINAEPARTRRKKPVS